MADIEFVIEAPQVTKTNKKRPRLVTSCDHCRVKKIKCVQQPSSGKCEACHSANVPCLYRDREQYFAERTRMLSGAGSALRDASPNVQSRAHLSAINASSPSPSRGITPPQSSYAHSSTSSSPDRSSPPNFYPYLGVGSAPFDIQQYSTSDGGYTSHSGLPTWDDPVDPLSWSSRRSPDIHSIGLEIPAPQSNSNLAPLFTLFDAHDTSQPHPSIMLNLLQSFFENLGTMYPFLSSHVLYERFLQRTLTPLLANAIAASATRFSAMPEIQQIGPANAADVYCQIAKGLIPSEREPATLDTLHAVMLLFWVEYKRGNHTMFNSYARVVSRLAIELGISEDTLPQLIRVADTPTARMLQGTWQGVQHLERTQLASELVAHTNAMAAASFFHLPPSSRATYPAPAPSAGQARSGASLW